MDVGFDALKVTVSCWQQWHSSLPLSLAPNRSIYFVAFVEIKSGGGGAAPICHLLLAWSIPRYIFGTWFGPPWSVQKKSKM